MCVPVVVINVSIVWKETAFLILSCVKKFEVMYLPVCAVYTVGNKISLLMLSLVKGLELCIHLCVEQGHVCI